MKYGWIAVVAMMAALFTTGQVAAQEWGQEAATESPPPAASDTAEVEDLGVRHPELFRELVNPDLLRSHVVDSTFHSRHCLADAGINVHPIRRRHR